ncbi:hypothetical protein V6N12_025233 [Hibiscus sabdariffa]|uniref:MYB-CC type transcription factor LHEQLE-containing domain-containing protein n=1 Tax=Hibiscus sabdariffa TaxID=183260 RepID=A0ABR2BNN9_9ROSI
MTFGSLVGNGIILESPFTWLWNILKQERRFQVQQLVKEKGASTAPLFLFLVFQTLGPHIIGPCRSCLFLLHMNCELAIEETTVSSVNMDPPLCWFTMSYIFVVDRDNLISGPSTLCSLSLNCIQLNTGWGKPNRQKSALATISKMVGLRIQYYKEIQSRNGNFSSDTGDGIHKQMNESKRISQALQMQMEVQRKLHEQIEVQRHLQLRIEAQGKYLQLVLKKAQETLVEYSSSSVGVELAKAELSQLVSMVNTGCTSSSFSELTEIGGSSLIEKERKTTRGTICSMGSSLTSSESSGEDNETPKNENICTQNVELSFMDSHQEKKPLSGSSNQANGKKRSMSDTSDGICVEQPVAKRLELPEEGTGSRLRKSGFFGSFDLNIQCYNDIGSGPKAIDLNCSE